MQCSASWYKLGGCSTSPQSCLLLPNLPIVNFLCWASAVERVVIVFTKLYFYCNILCYTVLYCTMWYFTLPYCTSLYYTVLFCTLLYCSVLFSHELFSSQNKCQAPGLLSQHLIVLSLLCSVSSTQFSALI